MKIQRLRKYNEGLTEQDEDALLEKEGCRRLTPDEFFDNCQDKQFDNWLPCRVQTPNGLLARGSYLSYYDNRRLVVADDRSSLRLGVLGVKQNKKTHLKPSEDKEGMKDG